MVEPWEFLIVALAAARITRFVVLDSLIGFNLDSGSKMSRRLDVFAYAPDGSDRSWVRAKIGDLLNCTYCTGFWITVACWAAAVWGPGWAIGFLTCWAAACVQALLNVADRALSSNA